MDRMIIKDKFIEAKKKKKKKKEKEIPTKINDEKHCFYLFIFGYQECVWRSDKRNLDKKIDIVRTQMNELNKENNERNKRGRKLMKNIKI